MPPLTGNAAAGRTAVSMVWLQQFSKRVPPHYSTSDVVTHIVVPETREQLCRYIDQLSVEKCGKPSYFISHRWASPFHHLLAALERHFGDNDGNNVPPNIHVWLDIFAVNQHPGQAQNDDLSKLQDVIMEANQTLLVMDDGGQVLRRVWCLFEIFKTVSRKGVQYLVVLAHDVNLMGLKDIFIKINVAEAQATCESDRQQILGDIKQTIGMDRLNDLIRTALVESAKLEVQQLQLQPQREMSRYVSVVDKAAKMLTLAGQYGEAEPLMRETLQLAVHTMGETSVPVVMAINNLAEVLRYQGHYSDAQPLQRQAVELIERIDEVHPLMAISLGNLAELEMALGHTAAAEPVLRRALEISKQVNGPDNVKTAKLMNSLASLLVDLSKLEEAEKFYRQAVAAIERELGPNDPELVFYITNLAGLLQERENHAAAQQMLARALALCTRTLGEEHPNTAAVLNNLAESLARQKRFAEAEPIIRRALRVREAVLGVDHPATANSLNNLGGLLMGQGKLPEAAEAFTLALRINKTLFGPDHPVVANRLRNLASVRQAQGQMPEAERLYREALAANIKVLGQEHADTTTSRLSLGHLLAAEGKTEAITHLSKALEVQRVLLDSDPPALLAAITQLAVVQYQLGIKHHDTLYLLKEAKQLAVQMQGETGEEVEQVQQFIEHVQDAIDNPLTPARLTPGRSSQQNPFSLGTPRSPGPSPLMSPLSPTSPTHSSGGPPPGVKRCASPTLPCPSPSEEEPCSPGFIPSPPPILLSPKIPASKAQGPKSPALAQGGNSAPVSPKTGPDEAARSLARGLSRVKSARPRTPLAMNTVGSSSMKGDDGQAQLSIGNDAGSNSVKSPAYRSLGSEVGSGSIRGHAISAQRAVSGGVGNSSMKSRTEAQQGTSGGSGVKTQAQQDEPPETSTASSTEKKGQPSGAGNAGAQSQGSSAQQASPGTVNGNSSSNSADTSQRALANNVGATSTKPPPAASQQIAVSNAAGSTSIKAPRRALNSPVGGASVKVQAGSPQRGIASPVGAGSMKGTASKMGTSSGGSSPSSPGASPHPTPSARPNNARFMLNSKVFTPNAPTFGGGASGMGVGAGITLQGAGMMSGMSLNVKPLMGGALTQDLTADPRIASARTRMLDKNTSNAHTAAASFKRQTTTKDGRK